MPKIVWLQFDIKHACTQDHAYAMCLLIAVVKNRGIFRNDLARGEILTSSPYRRGTDPPKLILVILHKIIYLGLSGVTPPPPPPPPPPTRFSAKGCELWLQKLISSAAAPPMQVQQAVSALVSVLEKITQSILLDS